MEEKNENTEREKMKTVNSNLDILPIFITVAPWAQTSSRLPRTTNHCPGRM